MGKWEPIFWIVSICGGYFVLLLLIDFLKSKIK